MGCRRDQGSSTSSGKLEFATRAEYPTFNFFDVKLQSRFHSVCDNIRTMFV